MIARLNDIIGFTGGLLILIGWLYAVGVIWARVWQIEKERNPWL